MCRNNGEDILNFALGYLGMQGVSVTIAVNKRLMQRLSRGEVETEAVLTPMAMPHTYVLHTKSSRPPGLLLCHESVHVAQYESGRLRKDGDTMIWEGNTYDNSVPYEQRPWEIEAFEMQKEIARAYREKQK